ncbi:MAG: Flp pilus assembly complex ATPase component TadA, partial [Candidatus Cloacimonetes bacterium]|nr:Flp pilus assembly complex ATPase component TadA [Candidatus Cloacimonadota bacterium]
HKNASDIDLGGERTNGKIWYRIYGHKSPALDVADYTKEEVSVMLLSFLQDAQKERLYENKSIDFALSLNIAGTEKSYRFRGSTYFERSTICANFRLVNQKLFSMADLEIPAPIEKRLNLKSEKSGLVLITGITGSGKSSTLDSIVDMNNRDNDAHIIVLGNPIEFVHDSALSLVTHREIGEDVGSFQRGTIEALRQDPDIVVVGEMRDAATMATVLEVTDSGHKVFSTLHTSSTVDSIHRIIAEFPPTEQDRIRHRLADTLKVVISQKLVPNKDGRLTLAKEILSVNTSVQSAIRNNNLSEIFQMLTEGKQQGMFTMQQDLYRLVKAGIITVETAMNYCNNKKVMVRLLKY